MRIENVVLASMRTPRENLHGGAVSLPRMRSAFFLFLTATLFMAVLSGCDEGSENTTDLIDIDPEEAESFLANVGVEPTTEEPEEVLEAMIAAYQSADSYIDLGRLQIWAAPTRPGEEYECLFTGDHAVFMERPNKIRIAVGDARVVSDGETMIYQSAMVPGQLLTLPAPEEMSLVDIFPEAIVLESMSMQELLAPLTWAPLQTVLFFADDPLVTLAPKGVELSLEAPEVVGGRVCDCVSVDFPGWGQVIYWIERETRLLLSVELPAAHFAPTEEDASRLSLILGFVNADFDVPFEENAFQFAGPEGLETVDRFSFPVADLLGRKIEELSFNDLDGEAVNINDNAGRVTAIAFWSSDSPIDRITLQLLDSLRNRYEGRGEVEFLTVNVDDPTQKRNETIQRLFDDDWGVEIPLLRDPNGETFMSKLGGEQIPSIVLFDQESRLQAVLTSDSPSFVTDSCLPAIEMLIGGDELYEEILEQIELNQTAFLEFRDNCIAHNVFGWFSPEEEPSVDPSATASENGETEDPGTETTDVPTPVLDLPQLLVSEMVYSAPNSRTDEDLVLWDQLLPLRDAAFDAVSIRKTDDAFFLAGFSQGEPTDEIEIPRESFVPVSLPAEESDEGELDQPAETLDQIPPILCVKTEQDPDGRRARMVLFQPLTQKASILNEQLETVAVHELSGGSGFIDATLTTVGEDEDADLFVSHFSPMADESKVVRMSLDGEQRWECELPKGVGPMLLQTVRNVDNRAVALLAMNGDIAYNIEINEGIYSKQFPTVPGTAGRVFNEWLLTQNRPASVQQGVEAALPGSARILAMPQLSHILAVSFDATGRLLWRTPIPEAFTPSGEPCVVNFPETNVPTWVQFGYTPEMGFLLLNRDGTIIGQGQAPEYDGIRLTGSWEGSPAVYVLRNEDYSVWTLQTPKIEETPAEETPEETDLPAEEDVQRDSDPVEE